MFIFLPYIFIAFLWGAICLAVCKKFNVRLSYYGTGGNNEFLGFITFFICVIGAGISLSLFHKLYSFLLNKDVLGVIFGLFIMAALVLAIVSIIVSVVQAFYKGLSKPASEKDK